MGTVLKDGSRATRRALASCLALGLVIGAAMYGGLASASHDE